LAHRETLSITAELLGTAFGFDAWVFDTGVVDTQFRVEAAIRLALAVGAFTETTDFIGLTFNPQTRVVTASCIGLTDSSRGTSLDIADPGMAVASTRENSGT